MSRLSRVWAIAVQDWRIVLGGRGWFKLPTMALLLLGPTAMVRGRPPPPGPPPPVEVAVAGPLPSVLEGRVRSDELAPSRIVSLDPLVVDGEVPPELRLLLDDLGGPPVSVVVTEPKLGSLRPVMILLLAISLLTGPMSESLPSERSERTLEMTLSASITRVELVVGKWLAWTLAAGGAAMASALGGILSGALRPGTWLIGLPLAIGVVVAFALWLVRTAGDVVGGATIPMRVLPVVAMMVAMTSMWLVGYHPVLGAAVPLGGAVVITAGVVSGFLAVVVALVTHVGATAYFLRGTAEALAELDPKEGSETWRKLLLLAAPTFLWWLAVGGPGVWEMAGRPLASASGSSSALAGGLGLLLLGLVVAGQPRGLSLGSSKLSAKGAVIAVVGGGVLSAALPILSLAGPPLLGPPIAALATWAAPTGAIGLVVLLGQELVFRAALHDRWGPAAAAIAWTVTVFPFDPLGGLLSGAVLGALASGSGFRAVLLARLTWWLLATLASQAG